jgi:hypothetical protein
MKKLKRTIPEVIEAGKKAWWILFGTFWILIGIIGIIAPILPGIPFFFFGLTLYAKGIKSFDRWLEERDLKPYLNFIFFIKTIYRLIIKQIKQLIGFLKYRDRIL